MNLCALPVSFIFFYFVFLPQQQLIRVCIAYIFFAVITTLLDNQVDI